MKGRLLLVIGASRPEPLNPYSDRYNEHARRRPADDSHAKWWSRGVHRLLLKKPTSGIRLPVSAKLLNTRYSTLAIPTLATPPNRRLLISNVNPQTLTKAIAIEDQRVSTLVRMRTASFMHGTKKDHAMMSPRRELSRPTANGAKQIVHLRKPSQRVVNQPGTHRAHQKNP